MKTCLIKDEVNNLELGFLFYFENKDIYIVELNDELKENDVPIFFLPFIKRNEYTIDIKWSKVFVEKRIVPSERQNINSILKNNNLKNYDEYKLLILSKGRCSQDDLSVTAYDNDLPLWAKKRLENNIKTATYIDAHKYLLEVGKEMMVVDIESYLKNNRTFFNLLNSQGTFKKIPGGSGIYHDEQHFIMLKDLKTMEVKYLDEAKLYQRYFNSNIIDTNEASKILNCSRQYINSLVNNGRLDVYKELKSTKLFKLNDIEKLKY